ncbi:MAG: hypothetical protein ACP5IT_11685 [Thermoproteota archaeon]|jgi:FlaG/FlaF family flagellin (archaellin)
MEDQHGISSVTTTILLVAISLVIVVAIVFWLSELVIAFTRLDSVSKIFSLVKL